MLIDKNERSKSTNPPETSTADIRVGELLIDLELFSARGNPDPAQERLEVTCKCGHVMDMPVTAMGMTMACTKCDAKTPIDRATATLRAGTPSGTKVSAWRNTPHRIHPLREKRLGELLVAEEIVSETQLNEALAIQKGQGGKVGEVLVGLGYVDMPTFVAFLAKQPGVASIDPLEYPISRDVASLIPAEFARENEVFPIDKLGHLLTVGMVCPLDVATIEKVETMTGLRVKPLLCTAEQIHTAIRRHSPPDDTEWVQVDELLSSEDARGSKLPEVKGPISAQIQQIELLPLLPGTIHLVNKVVHDEMSCIADLIDVVEMDPPLAAMVLSKANSPAYGMPGKVLTIEKAVSLLGMHETCTMVLNAAGNGLFTDWHHFDYQSFWTKALCCAAAANQVARAAGLKDVAHAYTAGLLHDIGRIALHEVAPGCYALVEKESIKGNTCAAEEKIIGLSHTDAGYVLAVAWGLPASIAEAIRCHHQPEKATTAQETVAVIAVADALSRAQEPGAEANKHVLDNCEESLKLLGLDRGTTLSLLDDYFGELERVFMKGYSSQSGDANDPENGKGC